MKIVLMMLCGVMIAPISKESRDQYDILFAAAAKADAKISDRNAKHAVNALSDKYTIYSMLDHVRLNKETPMEVDWNAEITEKIFMTIIEMLYNIDEDVSAYSLHSFFAEINKLQPENVTKFENALVKFLSEKTGSDVNKKIEDLNQDKPDELTKQELLMSIWGKHRATVRLAAADRISNDQESGPGAAEASGASAKSFKYGEPHQRHTIPGFVVQKGRMYRKTSPDKSRGLEKDDSYRDSHTAYRMN